MRCVSGSETWGRAGSLSRERTAVAHSGNCPDSWCQCGSPHRSPNTVSPRRSDISPTAPSTLNDYSQVRRGLPVAYVARNCVIAMLPANHRVAMVTVLGGIGLPMADDADRRGLAVPEMQEEAQRRMLKLVPSVAARNPVDVTGQFLNDPSLVDQRSNSP